MADHVPPADATKRFSSRVEYYVKSRPKYPKAVLDFCRAELGLTPKDQVADVGSGTGFLTELFLENGNTVFAVEPNEAMRLAAEKSLSRLPNFKSIDATAEATGLESGTIGFIVAGQAFHWFDRAKTCKEFDRILRPGGWIVLVWNERDTNESAVSFTAAYDAIVNEFATDRQKVRRENLTSDDSGAIAEFFAPQTHQLKKFENLQSLDQDGLLARALSSSYLPLPGQSRCDEMLDRLREIFRRYNENGRVVQHYVTKVYYGRLSSSSS